jgi:hypothetical protein
MSMRALLSVAILLIAAQMTASAGSRKYLQNYAPYLLGELSGIDDVQCIERMPLDKDAQQGVEFGADSNPLPMNQDSRYDSLHFSRKSFTKLPVYTVK